MIILQLTSRAIAIIFLPASCSALSSQLFGKVMPLEAPTVVNFRTMGIVCHIFSFDIILQNPYKHCLA